MPGMPLRSDRILRYVSAFCPKCHDEQPDRPLAQVQRLAGYLAEADGHVWLVRGCLGLCLLRALAIAIRHLCVLPVSGFWDVWYASFLC